MAFFVLARLLCVHGRRQLRWSVQAHPKIAADVEATGSFTIKVILAGMSANLCTESHLRELLERGFEVAVVKDATAAAVIPDGDGYAAALVNFRCIANAVWTTEEAVQTIEEATATN